MSFPTINLDKGDNTPVPPTFDDQQDIDSLNEETFGSNVTGDWEEHHFSIMGVSLKRDSEGHQPLVSTNTASGSEMELSEESSGDQKSISQFENLKELWEVSPDTPPNAESIWSPSSFPQPSSNKIGSPIHIKSTGSDGRVNPVSVQELEKQMMETAIENTPHSPLADALPLGLQTLHKSPSPPPLHYSHLPPHPFMYPHLARPPPGFPMMGPPPHPAMPPPARMPSFHGHGPILSHPRPYLPPNISLMGPPRIIAGFPPHPPPPLLVHPPPYRPPQPDSYGRHSNRPHNPSGINSSKLNEMLCDLKPDGSGFMTRKEKEWVIKVQLLQLHSANPSIDDYYYQKYIQDKHQLSVKEEGVVKSDGKTSSLVLPPPVADHKDKVQSVFEGTLGKVSVGSASAPRKTIDVAPSTTANEVKREPFSRKKQALISIEKMYTLLLEVEDVHSSLSSNDSEEDRCNRQHRKQKLCEQLFMLMNLSDDPNVETDNTHFQQLMSFSKGKKLFRRILPFLNEVKSKCAVYELCKNLITIIKKDLQDKILVDFLPSLSAVINVCTMLELNTVLTLLKPILSSKYANNEFFVSFITIVIDKGCKLSSSGQTQIDWIHLLSELQSLHQKSKSKSETLHQLLTPPSV